MQKVKIRERMCISVNIIRNQTKGMTIRRKEKKANQLFFLVFLSEMGLLMYVVNKLTIINFKPGA